MITAAGYRVTGLVLDADSEAATVELQATGRFATSLSLSARSRSLNIHNVQAAAHSLADKRGKRSPRNPPGPDRIRAAMAARDDQDAVETAPDVS